jgi:hypothetical protein
VGDTWGTDRTTIRKQIAKLMRLNPEIHEEQTGNTIKDCQEHVRGKLIKP